mmetsp:Transcript_78955/g.218493  ORF Transcript_78955/g.218493 Transcript_78955/m.218493 type:complete len:223 (+) Transcript_78955:631-1299(+)
MLAQVPDKLSELARLHVHARAVLGSQLALQALLPGQELRLSVAQLLPPRRQLALELCRSVLGGERLGLSLLGPPELQLQPLLQVFGPALQGQQRALVLAEERLGPLHQGWGQLQPPSGLYSVRLAHRVAHELEGRPALLVLHGHDLSARILQRPVLQLHAMRRCHDASPRPEQRLEHGSGERSALLRVGAGARLVDHHKRAGAGLSCLLKQDPRRHQVRRVC